MTHILAIGAHADDVELGCGASLLKWGRKGDRITIYTATDSAYNAPDGKTIRSAEDAKREAEAAAKRLGANLICGPFKCHHLHFSEPLNAALVSIIEEVKPDLVLTHWDQDTHPDHQALSKATLHASRRVSNVLMYESNSYIGTSNFDGRFFVDVSETLDEKIELVAGFKSEFERTKGQWAQSVRERACIAGRIIGVEYAEAFQVVKVLSP
jgi:LmbE family N-acetylglucosaminyl deacetylase